jgi:hypothetical protein
MIKCYTYTNDDGSRLWYAAIGTVLGVGRTQWAAIVNALMLGVES